MANRQSRKTDKATAVAGSKTRSRAKSTATSATPSLASKPARPHSDKYKVEAVARAASLLEKLRLADAPMTVDDLAIAIGVSRSIAAATLRTLQVRQLVALVPAVASEQPGPDRYRLGLAWLRLANVKCQQLDIREVALPVLRRVRDTVNETVSLGIRIGSRRVNLEYAEGQHEVRRITQPGFHVPLHIGAAGRVLMSALDHREFDGYVETGNLRLPHAPARLSRTRLIQEIEAVRLDGYAVVSGEITSDTAAVSAPIRDHVGEIVAALTISCPDDRFGTRQRGLFIRQVTKAAQDISLALGYDPDRNRAASRITRRAQAQPRSAANRSRPSPRPTA